MLFRPRIPEQSFDDVDFGSSWNAERIPLLQRTIELARNNGAKRSISFSAFRSPHASGGGAEPVDQSMDNLIDIESEEAPWTWPRKAKVIPNSTLFMNHGLIHFYNR